MAASPKLKIKAATAQEICSQYEVSPAAQALLKDKMPPLDFLAALIATKLPRDAVQFLSYGLPKRETVWWSSLCARDILPAKPDAKLAAALQAAEAWVYRPTEEHRRKAETTADAIDDSHPAQWTARAAFWSGGSMAPAEAPEVKPSEELTARAVSGAIVMAATDDPMLTEERYKRFLDYGIDIANGGTGRPPAKT